MSSGDTSKDRRSRLRFWESVLSPRKEGTSLFSLDPGWEERLADLEQLRLKKTKIEKEEKIIRQQLKEQLGDFQSAEAGDMVASISVSSRRSLDTARLKEELPDIVERYT